MDNEREELILKVSINEAKTLYWALNKRNIEPKNGKKNHHTLTLKPV